jgi:hypothetical protein
MEAILDAAKEAAHGAAPAVDALPISRSPPGPAWSHRLAERLDRARNVGRYAVLQLEDVVEEAFVTVGP